MPRLRRNEWNFSSNAAELVTTMLRESAFASSPMGHAEAELSELRGARRLDLPVRTRRLLKLRTFTKRARLTLPPNLSVCSKTPPSTPYSSIHPRYISFSSRASGTAARRPRAAHPDKITREKVSRSTKYQSVSPAVISRVVFRSRAISLLFHDRHGKVHRNNLRFPCGRSQGSIFPFVGSANASKRGTVSARHKNRS
jgi:hypothetical protein